MKLPLKICVRAGTAVWAGLLGTAIMPALGCGPGFPNSLLVDADQAARRAPEASFDRELERMKLVTTTRQAAHSAEPARQTVEVELQDLNVALQNASVPSNRASAILESHRGERQKIDLSEAAWVRVPSRSVWLSPTPVYVLRPARPNNTRIGASPPQVTPGLPQQFQKDLIGAVQGPAKPGRESISRLAEDLAAALSERKLSAPQQARLAKDIHVVLNNAYAPVEAQVHGNEMLAILKAIGVGQSEVQTLANDLKAIASELQRNAPKAAK